MLQNSQTYAADGKVLRNFFDFASQCALKEMITEKLILELFSDMFECCPESELQTLFELFKNVVLGEGEHKLQFEENDLHVCSRICRAIMCKLTVTHDLQFRGTLQRFLARCLPLTHPSGCNKRAYFNTSNTTSIESQADVKKLNDYLDLSRTKSTTESLELDIKKVSSDSESKDLPISHKIYRNFWGVQKYMNNPIQIFKKDQAIELDYIWIKELPPKPAPEPKIEETNEKEVQEKEEEGAAKSVDSYAEVIPTEPEIPDELKPKSNLLHILLTIEAIVKKFKASANSINASSTRIVEKYPKYLASLSLMGL